MIPHHGVTKTVWAADTAVWIEGAEQALGAPVADASLDHGQSSKDELNVAGQQSSLMALACDVVLHVLSIDALVYSTLLPFSVWVCATDATRVTFMMTLDGGESERVLHRHDSVGVRVCVYVSVCVTFPLYGGLAMCGMCNVCGGLFPSCKKGSMWLPCGSVRNVRD